MPYFSMASFAPLAGSARRISPVFNAFAEVLASMFAFAITPMYRAASFTDFPAVLNTGAATPMASDRESTSKAELLHAAANTSA